MNGGSLDQVEAVQWHGSFATAAGALMTPCTARRAVNALVTGGELAVTGGDTAALS